MAKMADSNKTGEHKNKKVSFSHIVTGSVSKEDLSKPNLSKKNLVIAVLVAAVLVLLFVVIKSSSKPKGPDPDKENIALVTKEVPMEFSIKNETNKEWQGVVMIIKGHVDFGTTEPPVSFNKSETEDGIFHKFQLGNIKPSETKNIKLIAYAFASDEIQTATWFEDSTGTELKVPENKTLVFE